MIARNALRRQRAIQGQVARADRKHPEVALAMQAGAREYPGPLFPEPHQSKPGSEAALNPAPFYDAPYYRDSGKLQNKVALKRTKEKVESEGKKCLLIPGGVSHQKFCERAVARLLKEFGTLDVLVNNAAGSAIINTGSVTGLLGGASLLDYSMTKGGSHAFTGSLATHLVPRGIRVNAVAPGPVWTPLNPLYKEAGDVSKFGADTPMKRLAQPEEIAPAYVLLALPHCSSITGAILPIIGGYSGG
jgi:NAD(P)-dependent dehydrogenase (short-subunit alcohol dehydrogenase family)